LVKQTLNNCSRLCSAEAILKRLAALSLQRSATARWFRVLVVKPLLTAALLFLTACASVPETTESEQRAPDDRAVVDGRVLPLPNRPKIEVQSLPGQQSQSPVVRRLMASAQRSRDAGDWEVAANSLERALRIEPRNALLWGQLADVRFRQANWQQAVQLAAKSNALAGSNQTLIRQNWYLMANAYDAMGKPSRAQTYRDKL